MPREHLKYRVAIRDDIHGTITYRKGYLPNLLRFLAKQADGILTLDVKHQIYLVPATHKMPWELPEGEMRDVNTKIQY